MREFGGNPNIAGAKLHVGSVDAIVAGVAFGGSTGLPGGANAWLLDSDSQVVNGKSEFVVGHLSPARVFRRWALGSVRGRDLARVPGVAFRPPTVHRRVQQWFAQAITGQKRPVLGIPDRKDLHPAGDCVLHVRGPRLFARATLLAIVGLHTVASAVALCLLGLGWAFRDQQRRCPICLRRMAHPVDVGQPSRTFLAWNGTELVCERGHTLLHIPETPTSWFGSQRWVCLDGSWQFLFARPNG